MVEKCVSQVDVYSIHLTSNAAGFPCLLEVETATFSELAAVDRKEARILHRLQPDTFCGDNAHTKARRIRQWAKQDVILHHTCVALA